MVSVLLSSLLCLLCTCFTTSTAQSTPDPCSSIQHYVDTHPGCYIDNFGGDCSGIYCYNDTMYLSVFVEECEDPASVLVHYDLYDEDRFEEFQYVFNQSEIVDNDGIYSYGDSGRYTGIMARNASHLGFELYVDRDGELDTTTILDPVYIPLNPAHCMCETMQAVAEDMHLLADYTCNTTDSHCSEILCSVQGSTLEAVTVNIYECDDPPTVVLGMVIGSVPYSVEVNDNTSTPLGTIGATLIVNVWYYQYSMDLAIFVSSADTYQEILSRHKIILDLTSCSPPEPLDLSTAPTPVTEFTEPTVSPTPTDGTYDACAALQSISVLDGTLCNTNDACTALECEIVDRRLEMQVDQCHDPPGIVIVMYNSFGQPVFNQSFYNGSTMVSDARLPLNLNVTVEQLPADAISVEVIGTVRGGTVPVPGRIVLVPKTVIPIDKSSCFTLAPPTSAPTTTCSAMRYIQTALSNVVLESCYFPIPGNCSTLTCPIGEGQDITIHLLRCARPPAVRLTYGNGFFTMFDHTFDHSEVVAIPQAPNDATFNVTLDQLCPSDIGLQIDVNSQFGSSTLVPYTIIPINTTGCGPGAGSGLTCPTATPTPTSGTPATTNTPTSPNTPTTSNTPTSPDIPTSPTSPDTPITSNTPTSPDTPSTDTPTSPNTPSTDTPTSPDTPSTDTPTSPDTPHPPVSSHTSPSSHPHPSPSPTLHTGQATPTPTLPPSSDICKAMNNITDQLNQQLGSNPNDSFSCSTSKSCEMVDCTSELGSLSIIRSCSPIGVTMKSVDKTTSKAKTDSKLFTKSGTFLKIYQVTVDQKSDKGFVFALKSKSDDGTFSTDEQLVNRTFIPTTSCDDSASPEGLSSSVVGAAVGVPLIVVLTLVTIIVIITVVYLMRRRRYRHYQLHQVAMSQLDDEPA